MITTLAIPPPSTLQDVNTALETYFRTNRTLKRGAAAVPPRCDPGGETDLYEQSGGNFLQQFPPPVIDGGEGGGDGDAGGDVRVDVDDSYQSLRPEDPASMLMNVATGGAVLHGGEEAVPPQHRKRITSSLGITHAHIPAPSPGPPAPTTGWTQQAFGTATGDAASPAEEGGDPQTDPLIRSSVVI